ncbi:hypothetical protein Efla_003908 [Eimeria flavescens]
MASIHKREAAASAFGGSGAHHQQSSTTGGSSSSSSGCSSSSCRVSAALFYGSFVCLFLVMAISAVYPLPTLLQMLLYTAPILYVGSHLSLKQNEVDAITGEKINKGEAMNRTDAFLFPVFGSVALFSLYLAYKFLSPAWVNLLLTLYLSGVGLIALGETLLSVARPLSPPALCVETVFSFRLPLLLRLLRRYCWGTPQKQPRQQEQQEQQQQEGDSGNQQQEQQQQQPEQQQPEQQQQQQDEDDGMVTFGLSPLFVISHMVALLICGLWLLTKNWALHNLLAIAFCIQAIAIVSVGSFAVAAILLSGLFVYDVFWVFGTEVMVSVAKAFEGPAKLIFPVQLSPFQYSILGLGDIVIPGVLISMCLRFDAFLAQQQQQTAASSSSPTSSSSVDIHQRFPKFYFCVVMVFYEVGLLTTGLVMFAVNHPQPALLYLVPYCLFSLFGAAALNGRVKEVSVQFVAAAVAAAAAAGLLASCLRLGGRRRLAYKEDEDSAASRPPLEAAAKKAS